MTKSLEQLEFESTVQAKIAEARATNNYKLIAKYTFALEVHPRLWPLLEASYSKDSSLDTVEGIAEAMGACLVSLTRSTSSDPPVMALHLLGVLTTAIAKVLVSNPGRTNG